MDNQQQTIKNRVFISIYNDILAGNVPVDAILKERVLVDQYQVSKSPVREALVELCSEGILRSVPRVGYQIVPVTPRELSDAQELRIILELAALDKSAETMGPEGLDQLDTYLARNDEQIAGHPKDILVHWSYNVGFHLLLCRFCGNSFLYDALDRVLKFCSRGAAQYFSTSWERGKFTDGTDHRSVVKALRENRLNDAKMILKKDISSMKNELLK